MELPFLPWGKFSGPDSENRRRYVAGGDNQFLPLHRHMLDVAAVFLELSETGAFKKRLDEAAGTPLTERQKQRLAVLVALHDVGKLNAGFQFQIFGDRSLATGHIAQGWQLLDPQKLNDFALALHARDIYYWGVEEGDTAALVLAVLDHHGRLSNPSNTRLIPEQFKPSRGYDPFAATQLLAAQLKDAFPDAFTGETASLPLDPEFQHFFCGLTALADQIGSREKNFPVSRQDGLSPFQALQDSRVRAREALIALGLDVSALRKRIDPAKPLASLFGWKNETPPRELQRRTAALSPTIKLAVLESETGSGKTEAAFMRFMKLFEAGEVDALYFATPTRSAALALQIRLNKASMAYFDQETFLAVPGYMKAGLVEGMPLPGYNVSWPDAGDEARDDRWAVEAPRRYLGAPVAVGTIDQALQAALQVKWSHFRAATLSRTLLVIDEVHASDAYMTEIGCRLAHTHVERGGHVLLMSATLGSEARAKWLGMTKEAKSPSFDPILGALPDAGDAHDAVAVPYPCLSWLEEGAERHEAFSSRHPSKTVALSQEKIIADPNAVAALALEKARQGLRVLVIRNTVKTAIDTLKALEELDPEKNVPVLEVAGVRTLHHSRFAAEDRKLLDHAVEKQFGKGAPAGARIAIGTQTLEQSLDIDADLLITDLCPIDVLLQRIGRLQRHQRTDRPAAAKEAHCIVLTPETLTPTAPPLAHGLGTRDGDGVYTDLRMLVQVERLIARKSEWTIPQDNRYLVEEGTRAENLIALQEELAKEDGESWNETAWKIFSKNAITAREGRHACVNREISFRELPAFSSDERIRTRLGADGVRAAFSSSPKGPFGEEISSIVIPAHMAREIWADSANSARPDAVSRNDDTPEKDLPPLVVERQTSTDQGESLSIGLGHARYVYDRFGLVEPTQKQGHDTGPGTGDA